MNHQPGESSSAPPSALHLVKEDDLRGALAARQLAIRFRPRIYCRTGTLKGFEVLPCWAHPEAGRIEAGELLEMAQARGLVDELASEMAEQSLTWLNRWRELAPDEPLGNRVLEEVRLSLPLPAPPPTSSVLLDTLAQYCRDHGVPPETITLELAAPCSPEDAQGLESSPLAGGEVLEWFRRRERRREAQRLEALEATGLLDTSPEERFDRLTRLAQHLLEVPITLITMVDRDRQWFKSRQGLAITETPRDIAFCHSTIQQDELMEVPDARRDERFRENPLVTGPPFIRFYAGQPLCLATGEKVGSLCIIESHPRRLKEQEKALLSCLALQVEEELAARLSDTQANAAGLLDETMFLDRVASAFSLCRRFGFNTVLVRVCMTQTDRIASWHGEAEDDDPIRQLRLVIAEAAIPAELVGRRGKDVIALLMEATLGEVRALCKDIEFAILDWNARRPRGAPRVYCQIDVVSATFDAHESLEDIWDGPWTRYATID